MHACPATINIAGVDYPCRFRNGNDHWNDEWDIPTMHEAFVPIGDGTSKLNVRWSTWRKVKPPRVGGGAAEPFDGGCYAAIS